MTVLDNWADLHRRARSIRRTVLEMGKALGQGYIGQGLETADLLATLYFHEMRIEAQSWDAPSGDRFVLSTGHLGIGVLATLGELGLFTHEELLTYGRPGSRIEESPLFGTCPGIEASGGSLGQGLSIANGMALGNRLAGRDSRVYCLISDGELQEGAIWEAAMAAGHYRLDNLVVLIDVNGIQADGATRDIMDIEPISDKWRSFNWFAQSVDGHSTKAIVGALSAARDTKGKPSVLVCYTRPCEGSPMLQARPKAHYIRMGPEEWDAVIREFEEISS